jgi:hypothetical protein
MEEARRHSADTPPSWYCLRHVEIVVPVTPTISATSLTLRSVSSASMARSFTSSGAGADLLIDRLAG